MLAVSGAYAADAAPTPTSGKPAVVHFAPEFQTSHGVVDIGGPKPAR
jgi:hypothetical protein